MKNSIKTNQTAGNAPGGGASRTIVKFIALLTLLNWAVALHFVSAAEVPGQQQAAQATPIPWNEIGAAASKQYQGDGLAVAATEEGARLYCVFQKLEGHATRDGLWLVSTTAGAPGGRFRVTALAVGRTCGAVAPLPGSGTVRAQDTLVRFERPGLTEEYSASLDGIRQDFVIAERPAGAGGLCVELNRAASKKQIPISSVQFSSVQFSLPSGAKR